MELLEEAMTMADLVKVSPYCFGFKLLCYSFGWLNDDVRASTVITDLVVAVVNWKAVTIQADYVIPSMRGINGFVTAQAFQRKVDSLIQTTNLRLPMAMD